MATILRVSQGGRLVLVAPISQMYARSLALMGMVLSDHLVERAEHAPVLLGRVVLTVEDALQTNWEAHRAWTALYTSGYSVPVEIEVLGLNSDEDGEVADGVAGAGGNGAWPGGGGGGGGNGSEAGGPGGGGADGAMVLLLFDAEGGIVDIETGVTAGSSDWVCQKGVASAKVILIGGGGGGGGGCRDNSLIAALYRVKSPYAIQYTTPRSTTGGSAR